MTTKAFSLLAALLITAQAAWAQTTVTVTTADELRNAVMAYRQHETALQREGHEATPAERCLAVLMRATP